MSDDLIQASDGLPARRTGPWAKDKLLNLDRYAQMVTTAIKGKFAEGLIYVDLMAGPGRCVDVRSRVSSEFSGSTLIALDTRYPFNRVIAVESHPISASAPFVRVFRLIHEARSV